MRDKFLGRGFISDAKLFLSSAKLPFRALSTASSPELAVLLWLSVPGCCYCCSRSFHTPVIVPKSTRPVLPPLL